MCVASLARARTPWPDAVSVAALVAKPKPVPRTTPAKAESNRELARQAAASDRTAGNHAGAASTLEDAGTAFGDPLLFLEAAEVCLAGAEADGDVELAERAKRDALIALDILQFHRESDTKWQVVDESVISVNIDRANEAIRNADAIVAQIEAQQAETQEQADRSTSGGRVMVITGSALVGVGGVGVALVGTGLGLGAARQKDVEALDLNNPADQAEYDDLDEKGKRANVIAYVGAAVAAVGLAAGIALIVVGKKRQREAGSGSASLRIVPGLGGATLVGRF